jgi:hypothetical protein
VCVCVCVCPSFVTHAPLARMHRWCSMGVEGGQGYRQQAAAGVEEGGRGANAARYVLTVGLV